MLLLITWFSIFKDGNTYILDNKSSSDMISDMTLLIAIDTPAITGREPIAIQSSSLYSKQDINNILIDNRENKLLITEGSSMKTSQTLTSDLNTLTFITLKDENNVDINLLNNTDVVLDRVNSYSFFSSTDDLGLSVYISESFVAKNPHSLAAGKTIMDTLADRDNSIYILTDSNIYHGTNPNNIDEFKNNAETPVPFDVSNMNSFVFEVGYVYFFWN